MTSPFSTEIDEGPPHNASLSAPSGNTQNSRFPCSFGSLACSSHSEDALVLLIVLEETTNAHLSNGVSFVV